MKSLKYLIFLSFFILTFSSLQVHGSLWERLKRFFGLGNPKNTSYKMPVVENIVNFYPTSRDLSLNQNFKNFIIYVALKFSYEGRDLYFPVNPQNFTLSHIDTRTKLAKFKKKLKEVLPEGLYGLEKKDILQMKVLVQNIPMTEDDSLKDLLESTGTINATPVKALILIHPSSHWVDMFKNMDYEKLSEAIEEEFKRKKQGIIRDMVEFFESINIWIGLHEDSELHKKKIDKICRKQLKKYSNDHIKSLIHVECEKWRHVFKKAYETYESKRQKLAPFH